ncbi:MAG: septum formation inhibitor Maf [bacterium]
MQLYHDFKHISFNLGFLLFLLINMSLVDYAVAGGKEKSTSDGDENAFQKYWFSGQAEITRYALEQARYGEIHKGDAVLIFVTEDFLTDKQVKYEFGDAKHAIPILKLNFTKKFYTGIYPYSIMTSIFTPVDVNKNSTLKVTSSSQEWCGHTFMQLNARNDKFDVLLRSYFQNEGDQEFELKSALLEDEVWTKIRLAPNTLPTGSIKIIPGLQFARLRHVPLKIEKATARLSTLKQPSLSPNELWVYAIEYQDIKRKLVITFEKNFPYRILAWEESHPSGFGAKAKMLTTRAVKTHAIKSPYWSKNKVSDSYLRDNLGLIY